MAAGAERDKARNRVRCPLMWLLAIFTLQGDNVKVSHDSRSFGPVPYALITGRVWLQVEMGWGMMNEN